MWRRAFLVALYAGLTAVMIAPLANYSALATASYPGDARLNIWALAWSNHAILTGQPLFGANIYFPSERSLAYTEHLFSISLLTLPIFAATRNAVLGYNVVWLLSFVCNALAMHALLRRYVRHDLAAFVGSVFYAFTFYRMLHGHGHLQLIWTCGLPLSVLALHRWNDHPSRRRVLLWAGALTLQSLVSWYLAVLTLLVNAALGSALAIRWRTGVLERGTQAILAGLIVAACVWPFAREYRGLQPATRAEAASNSADLAAYVIPPENTRAGQAWLAHIGPGPRWIWGERTMFLGWIAISLSLAGAAIGIRAHPRLTIFYLLLGMAAYNLSLGPAVRASQQGWRLYDLLSSLQPIGAFRAPARFAEIVILSMSVLVALTVAAARVRFPRATAAGVIAVIPLMLSEYYLVGFPGGKPQPLDVPAIYSTPELRSARALVSLPDYRGTPAWYNEPDYLLFSTVHWRPIVNGYGRSEPPEHFRVISHMNAFPGPNNARTMRRLGVEYVVLHTARIGPGAEDLVKGALDLPHEYELVTRNGGDYLFRVKR